MVQGTLTHPPETQSLLKCHQNRPDDKERRGNAWDTHSVRTLVCFFGVKTKDCHCMLSLKRKDKLHKVLRHQ